MLFLPVYPEEDQFFCILRWSPFLKTYFNQFKILYSPGQAEDSTILKLMTLFLYATAKK